MATRHSAFITGAGRNIGRATALELARRGVSLIINGARNRAICDAVAAEAAAHGVEAVVLMGDVGDAAEAKRLAEAALQRFGTIDILVNNAAIRPHQGFLEISDADWHRVIDIDLNAAMHFARAFLPGMIAQGWGRIVNFTGMNAIMGNPAGAHISAAKHGIWGLTKALAREFGPQGITVNAISPTFVRVPQTESLLADEAFYERLVARIPLRRIAETDDLVGAILFFCSDASSFVTWQVLTLDGGLTATQ